MKTVLDSEEIRIESWLSEAQERCLANDVLDSFDFHRPPLPPLILNERDCSGAASAPITEAEDPDD